MREKVTRAAEAEPKREPNYAVYCKHSWAGEPMPLLFPTPAKPTVTKMEADAYAKAFKEQQDHECLVVVEPWREAEASA